MKRGVRAIALLVVGVLFLTTLAGCGDVDVRHTDKPRIVCTAFPQYDWVREILGDQADRFDLILLNEDGADLHSFQPTAADIVRISTADLFVYIGGNSDLWVEDALKEAVNENMQVISLMDQLGDRVWAEEHVEGMEEERGHHHDHEEDHDHEEEEYDEHIWLSLRNAEAMVDVLTEAICKLDPEQAQEYRAHSKAYREELEALDAEYTEVTEQANVHTLVFGDRFPFRYLTEDYGLEYYAAFPGCSAETEASFETITFLAGKVDENGLNAILVIDGSDERIAETIRDNTKEKNQSILMLQSLQSVSRKQMDAGTTYLSGMRENLEVLRDALQ